MSDDEDYMSDKFLEASKNDKAPSLVYRYADKREFMLAKRKIEIETKLKEKNKTMKAIEQEKRDEGLSSAIKSTNKGFEMLMKMGYKPGLGIGKTESGIVEPINVNVKSDRCGLGKAVKKQRLTNENLVKIDNSKMSNFRDRISEKRSEQVLKTDLQRSQKVCEQLDMQRKINKPCETWFWLNTQLSEDENVDDDEDDDTVEDDQSLTIGEKLDILTKYLREKYFYCIWCGTVFEDENDLKDNCPGNTRNEH